MRQLFLRQPQPLSPFFWRGAGGGEADAALNFSVPERYIEYALDWSYAATVTDDLHAFILTKI